MPFMIVMRQPGIEAATASVIAEGGVSAGLGDGEARLVEAVAD